MTEEISDVLDWSGFSQDEIQQRKTKWDRIQFIPNVLRQSVGFPFSFHITGSRAEASVLIRWVLTKT